MPLAPVWPSFVLISTAWVMRAVHDPNDKSDLHKPGSMCQKSVVASVPQYDYESYLTRISCCLGVLWVVLSQIE